LVIDDISECGTWRRIVEFLVGARIREPSRVLYYFTLRNTSGSIPDEQGIELSSFDQVRAEVLQTIEEMWEEDPELAKERSAGTLMSQTIQGQFSFQSV
jgi:hypothetical protein